MNMSYFVSVLVTLVIFTAANVLGQQPQMQYGQQQQMQYGQQPQMQYGQQPQMQQGQQQQMMPPIHSARVYMFSATNLLTSTGGNPQNEQNIGMIDFRSMSGSNGGVMVNGSVYGLTAGNHAMHVHPYGDIGAGCSRVGPPFNPTNAPLDGSAPIVGNMGNVNAQGSGVTNINMNQSMMSLMGPWSIIGRSVVIHTGNTTNIGQPFACGVLGIMM